MSVWPLFTKFSKSQKRGRFKGVFKFLMYFKTTLLYFTLTMASRFLISFFVIPCFFVFCWLDSSKLFSLSRRQFKTIESYYEPSL
jgi:hypothetical protein